MSSIAQSTDASSLEASEGQPEGSSNMAPPNDSNTNDTNDSGLSRIAIFQVGEAHIRLQHWAQFEKQEPEGKERLVGVQIQCRMHFDGETDVIRVLWKSSLDHDWKPSDTTWGHWPDLLQKFKDSIDAEVKRRAKCNEEPQSHWFTLKAISELLKVDVSHCSSDFVFENAIAVNNLGEFSTLGLWPCGTCKAWRDGPSYKGPA